MNLQASIRIPRRARDGETGDGIVNTVISYAKSESGTTPPSTGWTSTLPTPTQGWYLWTRTVTTYRIRPATTTYSVSSYAKNGESGLPGQIPIQKEWVAGDTHRNTDEIVDYIYVRGADKNTSYWYKLASKGTVTAGAPPTGGATPSGYLRIDWLKELAVNVLLAEEANVAGFIFKGGQLISVRGTVGGVDADYSGQANFVPNLILDGTGGDVKITGTVNATSGSIGKWNIVDGSLYSDYAVGASIKVEQAGGRFLRINESTDSAMLAIRADNDTALSIYTQSSTGVGIHITAQTGGMAIDSFGGHNFVQRNAEKWNAPGVLMIAQRPLSSLSGVSNVYNQKWMVEPLKNTFIYRAGRSIELRHNIGHTDYVSYILINSGSAEVDSISHTSEKSTFNISGTYSESHEITIVMIGRNKA